MNKFIKNKVFFTLLLIFLVFCIIFGINVSYGAYIRRSYIKAVIATNETEKLFGSNLLYGVKNQPENPDSDGWLSVYPFTVSDSNQSSITVPIKIYNYLTEDHDRVNQLDVSYIISFRVAGNPTIENNQLQGYSVNGHTIEKHNTVYYLGANKLVDKEDDSEKQTLPGRLQNMNTYNITLPRSDIGKISIAVKAKRVSNEGGNYGTDLLYLAARVVPSPPSTVQEANVTGKFSYGENATPKDYAAYNYSIELSGAPTAIVLSWNKDLLEIDPFFKEKYGVKPSDGQVIFNMEPGITKVQFYRKGNIEKKTWDALGVSVTKH